MIKRKVLSMFVMGGIATTLAIPSAFASNSENDQTQEREHTANHVYHHHHYLHKNHHAAVASNTSQEQNRTASSTSVTKPTTAAAPIAQPVAAQSVKSAAAPTGQAVQSSQGLTASQQKLMDVAKSQIGVRYLWGHQVPGVGFDCSNFTSWVYKDALGINFSSSSRQQRYNNSIGRPVPLDPSNKLANLQVGDLLFFKNSADRGDGSVGLPTSGGGGHVGIYAGNGMVIQEGGGRAKVTYEKMAGTWFLPSLVYAKRILN